MTNPFSAKIDICPLVLEPGKLSVASCILQKARNPSSLRNTVYFASDFPGTQHSSPHTTRARADDLQLIAYTRYRPRLQPETLLGTAK